MKTVLIIAFEFPPIRASNDRTYHFCKYIAEYGWRPIVVSPRKPPPRMLHDYTLPIPPSVEVYDAPAYQNIWVGRFHYILGLLPDTNLFMVSSYISGKRILMERGSEINLIYATTPSASALFSAYLLSKRFGKPLVVDFRDPFYPPVIYRRLLRVVLDHASKIITTTNAYRDILIEQGAEKDKIEIIPNGTDLETINTLRKKGIDRPNKFRIIYAGVLIPLYRVKALLKAVASLRPLDIQVVIVGRVEDDTEGLAAFAKENNLDNVEFRGRLSQEDTLRELLHATVAYNGSAHPGGIGGKVYDYLACGLPLIGYNPPRSATASFIKEHAVGLTAEAEEGLAENLRTLYNDPSTVEKMAGNALTLARQYDRKELTKRLASVLDSIK